MWQIVDPNIASVQGSAQVRSLTVGKTQLICRDHKNYNNWDAIDVEVTHINQFKWLEELVELKARTVLSQNPADASDQTGSQKQLYSSVGESRLLSLVALDSKGRKFTNCTAVRPSYELRGETIVSIDNQGAQSSEEEESV